jgi:hypothetical protein
MLPPMNWQQLLSLAIVAITVGFFIRAWWLRRRASFPAGSPCGCATPQSGETPPSITFHVRKGHRPEVRVQYK